MAQHHAIMLSHTQLKRPACIRVDRQRIFLTLIELVDSQPVGPADLVERCIQRGTGPAAELHDQHRLTQLKGSARGHVLRPQIGQRQHHRVQLALLTGTLAVRQLEVVITLAGLVEPQLLAIGITPVRGGDLLQRNLADLQIEPVLRVGRHAQRPINQPDLILIGETHQLITANLVAEEQAKTAFSGLDADP